MTWERVDDRDFSGMKAISTLFWRGYASAVRDHTVAGFLDAYSRYPMFAGLVQEARLREMVRQDRQERSA